MKFSLLIVFNMFLIGPSQAGWIDPSVWNSNFLGYFQWLVPNSFIENNVFFYLYSRSNTITPNQLYINNRESLMSSYFDKSKKTVIIVHGWNTNYLGDTAQRTKQKYLANEDVNFIALDYGGVNDVMAFTVFISYLVASFSSVKIGNHLGKLIGFLIEEGVNPEDIHVIGHSLGAHIAGFTGKYTTAIGHPIGRITGLDPCYPFYEGSSTKYRLSPTDAVFTDCIWTSYDTTGMGSLACQANFFPNGVGKSQPGCYKGDLTAGGCSHGRCVDYYIESVGSKSAFQSNRCLEIPRIDRSVYCFSNVSENMGRFAKPKIGIFYLETNSQVPFSQS